MASDTGRREKVIVGICAMSKKSRSRPMREIIVRLEDFNNRIKVVLWTKIR